MVLSTIYLCPELFRLYSSVPSYSGYDPGISTSTGPLSCQGWLNIATFFRQNGALFPFSRTFGSMGGCLNALSHYICIMGIVSPWYTLFAWSPRCSGGSGEVATTTGRKGWRKKEGCNALCHTEALGCPAEDCTGASSWGHANITCLHGTFLVLGPHILPVLSHSCPRKPCPYHSSMPWGLCPLQLVQLLLQ